MTSTESLGAVQRRRMRHSWWFALLVVALISVSEPAIEPDEPFEFLGSVLLILAVAGRCACTLYIGGRKSTKLVTAGPYSTTRNPLYVASFVGVIGAGLALGMVSVAALLALGFALYYPGVVSREEAHLRARHGAAFDAYAARTPRWFPNPRLWTSPDVLEVRPRLVLKTFLDAGWWLLLLPLSMVVHALRDAGWFPVLLALP